MAPPSSSAFLAGPSVSAAPSGELPGGDAGARASCSFELPAPAEKIELVPSPVLARAIVPSLDSARMTAKVTRTKEGAPVVQDCRGGVSYAKWAFAADGVRPPPGTVKVTDRQSMPDGREAVWVATTASAPDGACWNDGGAGLLAIVRLDGQRVTVVGVGRWQLECRGARHLRAEKLGDETVYVDEVSFGTGGGWSASSEDVWTIASGELKVVGSYYTFDEQYDDATGVVALTKAKVRYSADGILLDGRTEWSKSGEALPGHIKRAEKWSLRYTLRDGKLVRTPVPDASEGPLREHEYQAALPTPDIEDLCDAGDAGACVELAGWAGDRRDDAGALALLTRAVALDEVPCGAGDPAACRGLGVLHAMGQGVPKDPGRAVALYQRACDGGDGEGCRLLGIAYVDGVGVVRDEAHAFEIFTKGCGGAIAPADCDELGALFDRGQRVTRDYARAAILLKESCDRGGARGCFDLGNYYDNGKGVAKDPSRAVQLWERACSGELAAACFFAGGRYASGQGVAQDQALGARLLERGCTGDDARACANLGVLYELGTGVARDDSKAASLYEKSCDRGDAAGCTNLGEACADGRGVRKDEARAVQLFKQACGARNTTTGCFGLGLMHERGLGVPRDRAEAVRQYEQGCKSGDDWFCKQLRRLGESR